MLRAVALPAPEAAVDGCMFESVTVPVWSALLVPENVPGTAEEGDSELASVLTMVLSAILMSALQYSYIQTNTHALHIPERSYSN